MKLYSYWRSSTSFRVRAALNLKGIAYKTVAIDLLAGDQRSDGFLNINPSAGVPALELDDGSVLTQSMAILEYLDAKWPEPGLIPNDPLERARVMAIAHAVATDIHPVNNTRVIGQLQERFKATHEDCTEWMRYWMADGFRAIEDLLPSGRNFASGDHPGIADICIVAQVYNARRWQLDLETFPGVERIENLCLQLPQIVAAHPDNQPEAKDV